MSETSNGGFRNGAALAPKTSRRNYNAPSRDEQKRETRKRILDCAMQHFSERGFEASSLRDLAREAEVSFAAVQKHFGSKEALWQAAIDEMFSRQAQELGLAEWSTKDRLLGSDLRELIHRYVRYCARHPEHVRIMVHESLRDTDRVAWVAERHTRRIHEPFVRLLTQASADGLVAPAPMPSLMYVFTSASQTMFALGAEVKHTYGIDVYDTAVVNAHANAICTMLLRA